MDEILQDIKQVLELTEKYVAQLHSSYAESAARDTLEMQMRRECMLTLSKFFG